VFKSGDLNGTSLKAKDKERLLPPQCPRRSVLHRLSEKSATAPNHEVAMEPKRRKLEWVERPNFQGWACTECAWVFNLSWPLTGKSIEEMKKEFGQHLDKEFASHVCAEHPGATKNPR
jgi:hypothetical protein